MTKKIATKKKTKAVRLPDKLSDLINVALRDMEQIEIGNLRLETKGLAPRYHFDITKWHRPDNHDDQRERPKTTMCSVCFAGSVMTCSLNGAFNKDLDPTKYPEDTRGKLYALDNIRKGQLLIAYANSVTGRYIEPDEDFGRKTIRGNVSDYNRKVLSQIERRVRIKWGPVIEMQVSGASTVRSAIENLSVRVSEGSHRNLFKLVMRDIANELAAAGF